MVGIWLFVVSNFFYFLPLVFDVCAVVDLRTFKVYFCIKLFKISLIGGYCTFDKSSIYAHISKKTAIKVDYSKIFKGRKTVFDFNAATVLSVKSSVLTNFNGDFINYFLMFLCVLNASITPVIKTKKGYMRIKNDLTLSEKDSGRAIFLKVTLAANLFSINTYLIVKLLEKIKNAKRKIKYRKSA